MYVCMYVRMYVCMYVCIYICMYVCMYNCIYVCMYVCIYVHTYIIMSFLYLFQWYISIYMLDSDIISYYIISYCSVPLTILCSIYSSYTNEVRFIICMVYIYSLLLIQWFIFVTGSCWY